MCLFFIFVFFPHGIKSSSYSKQLDCKHVYGIWCLRCFWFVHRVCSMPWLPTGTKYLVRTFIPRKTRNSNLCGDLSSGMVGVRFSSLWTLSNCAHIYPRIFQMPSAFNSIWLLEFGFNLKSKHLSKALKESLLTKYKVDWQSKFLKDELWEPGYWFTPPVLFRILEHYKPYNYKDMWLDYLL